MEYKLLPQTFYKKGFDFEQVKRNQNFAIYKRTKSPQNWSYEVIKILRGNGFSIKDKNGKEVKFEPSESFPSSEQWGTYGFTYSPQSSNNPLQDAINKFNELVNLDNQKLTKGKNA